MKSIIRHILYGKKGTLDSVRSTKEHDIYLDKVIEHDDELRAKLESNPELLTLYRKVNDSISKLNHESAAAHFAEGFKLGVLLGLELAQD